jgi:hypothetical protein
LALYHGPASDIVARSLILLLVTYRLPALPNAALQTYRRLSAFLSYGTHLSGSPGPPNTQCPCGQHTLAHTVCPGSGHWQLPFTQISASRQPQPQQPQLSRVFRGTHLPPQQPSPSAHTLPQRPQLNRSKTTFVHTPRQRRSSGEGHGPRPAGGAAQAMPGMEASAVPNSMPPTIRRALRRGIVSSASALDSSSKECSMLTSSRLLAATGSLLSRFLR